MMRYEHLYGDIESDEIYFPKEYRIYMEYYESHEKLGKMTFLTGKVREIRLYKEGKLLSEIIEKNPAYNPEVTHERLAYDVVSDEIHLPNGYDVIISYGDKIDNTFSHETMLTGYLRQVQLFNKGKLLSKCIDYNPAWNPKGGCNKVIDVVEWVD